MLNALQGCEPYFEQWRKCTLLFQLDIIHQGSLLHYSILFNGKDVVKCFISQCNNKLSLRVISSDEVGLTMPK